MHYTDHMPAVGHSSLSLCLVFIDQLQSIVLSLFELEDKRDESGSLLSHQEIRSTCPMRNEGALIREGKTLELLIVPQYMWGDD